MPRWRGSSRDSKDPRKSTIVSNASAACSGSSLHQWPSKPSRNAYTRRARQPNCSASAWRRGTGTRPPIWCRPLSGWARGGSAGWRPNLLPPSTRGASGETNALTVYAYRNDDDFGPALHGAGLWRYGARCTCDRWGRLSYHATLPQCDLAQMAGAATGVTFSFCSRALTKTRGFDAGLKPGGRKGKKKPPRDGCFSLQNRVVAGGLQHNHPSSLRHLIEAFKPLSRPSVHTTPSALWGARRLIDRDGTISSATSHRGADSREAQCVRQQSYDFCAACKQR